ncbi:twin-arginine translocase TatA/TatE family subunit [Desulfobulbus oligotrophicus]|jgi:sec-independent protein translocase protein TatB|uniref:Twin-arginine translocase TatA/TatE family subunit n=1 Tax=Desulfobulbus oligotrophicus TaxID=1909699 RepID=A0A7T5VDU5_9BACT|nr:twin-arginine translocase TatA/TatE family subunit [Desulfobulbus oligotrophicus]MDY0389432.1 twin-arginine translocase TatA/TatE family subunit [Desulfobulbus oligotrophicus]QQG65927.1 twin-arginine translocase TatA/TatE family subunit [Desulfobulbus oligotrophicus]
MFGIGLPEMIVIFAVALIVVGPDKLPGLAKSMAKGLMDLKKTLHQVREELTKESESLNSVQDELRKTADELRGKMIGVDPSVWQPDTSSDPNDEPLDIDPEPEARAIEAEFHTDSQILNDTAATDQTTPEVSEADPTSSDSPDEQPAPEPDNRQ